MHEGENVFSYYDLSSRDNVAEKRRAFNEWASRMPESERIELRKRMMSSTGEFHASETELVVHEILSRLGFSIEIHPMTPSGKRIDFLANCRDARIFIEVTTILSSKDVEAAQNRKAVLINAINEIPLPAGHCFGFDIEEAGPASPNTREFCKKIECWVAEKIPADTKEFPAKVFVDRGWAIEITLFNTGSDRIHDRSIGFQGGGVGFISPADDLKKKLESKSKRYGRLDKPFVIAAADFKNPIFDEDDVFEALFGHTEYAVNQGTRETRPIFRPSGFFGHSENKKNQHVSAVLCLPGEPYWAAKSNERHALLVLNPFAAHPLEPGFLPFKTKFVGQDGRLKSEDGMSFHTLLFGE